jgi:hypothetical protein
MKNRDMKKAFVVAMVLGAAALVVPNAYAICGVSVPMFHGLDSYFACDNSRGPVAAFSYQVASPTTINTGVDPIAVDLAPGQVQIQTNWADNGVNGCPTNIALPPGEGNTRLMISVQATDGTGVLLSISGKDAGVLYLVEAAHTFDPDSGLAFPVQCSDRNGRPVIRGVTTNTVDIHVDPPIVKSDCDPDSVFVAGLGLLCPDGFTQAATVGRIFTSIQACGTKPNVDRNAWTATTVQLNAAGDGSVPYTQPSNAGKTCATDPTCLCFYVGTSISAGGTEGQSIAGFIQVAGSLAAPPTAENVRAATDAGKVKLSWSTSNEVGLAGFRLVAVSKNKGQFEIGSLIAAKGSPSSYTAEARMGDLKGSRSIIIRSVLTDGTSVDAAPVNF